MPVNKFNKNFYHPNVVMYDGTNIDQVKKRLAAAFKRKGGEEI